MADAFNVSGNLSPFDDHSIRCSSVTSDDNECDDNEEIVSEIHEAIKAKVCDELKDELVVIQNETNQLVAKLENSRNVLQDENLDALDPNLKKAILKMRRLDKILEGKELQEKEVKRQRILLHKRLCQELKSHDGRKLSHDELTNTEKFLALEPPPSHNEGVVIDEVYVPPLFDTQPNEDKLGLNDVCDTAVKLTEHCRTNPSPANTRQSECSTSINIGSSRDGEIDQSKPQKDFIARNIKLAADADSVVPMTDDDKSRVKLLLADICECSDDESTNENNENPFQVSVVSVPTGFQPEVTQRDDLDRIDSRLKELLLPEEYKSLCGPLDLSVNKPVPLFSHTGLVTTSVTRLTNSVDLRDATLQSVHDDRSLHQKLKSVDEELNNFYKNTPRDIESGTLSKEQLDNLLDDCTEQLKHLIAKDNVDPQVSTDDSVDDGHTSDGAQPHSDETNNSDHSDAESDDSSDKSETDLPNSHFPTKEQYTMSSEKPLSREDVMSRLPKLPDAVLHALLEEARKESQRVNYLIAESRSESPRFQNVPGMQEFPQPYLIYSDVDEGGITRDESSHEAFLPEIPPQQSLISNANVQTFTPRSRISLHNQDFK